MTDLDTYFLDYADTTVFGLYKKESFSNDAVYLGDYMLEHIIELPDKDVLLGLKGVYLVYDELEDHTINKELKKTSATEFYKLSDVILSARDIKKYYEEE